MKSPFKRGVLKNSERKYNTKKQRFGAVFLRKISYNIIISSIEEGGAYAGREDIGTSQMDRGER